MSNRERAERGPTAGISPATDPHSLLTADRSLPDAPRLRETELHQLWLEQRFPADALTTVAGEPVRVLYRGRPGGGAGPDFRDARVSVGGRPPRLGDVELHVAAADFRRHGHPADGAYARVVLHVVFEPDGERETPLPGGGRAPVVALRPWVERRSAEIESWLARREPWREPCHSAVAGMGVSAVRAVLAEGGERRLRAKADAIAAELHTDQSEQVLYRALCAGLGLTRNVEPFRLLADRLPLVDLLSNVPNASEEAAVAHLRHRLREVAGFGAQAPALGALPWRLDGLRPNAHPAKRLDGLAVLLARCRTAGLIDGLSAAARAGAPTLLRSLQAPGIGRDRAVEIAINAVVPFLIATGDAALALRLAATLPAPAAYGALAGLSTALVERADDQSKPRSLPLSDALAQQGALALHREWCRRGGCGVCPLS